jgi:hypothetical protein
MNGERTEAVETVDMSAWIVAGKAKINLSQVRCGRRHAAAVRRLS